MFEAKTIMKTDLVMVNRHALLYDAIGMLVKKNVTGLPVIDDDGTIVGIISEKDMLQLLYNIEDRGGSVEDYMTTEVVSFTSEDSLIDISESFIKNHFRRVPIIDKGKPVGIISRRDIIAYILKLRHKNKVTT